MGSRPMFVTALALVVLAGLLAPMAQADEGGRTGRASTAPGRTSTTSSPGRADDGGGGQRVPLERPSPGIALDTPPGDAVRTGAAIIKGRPVARGTHPYVALVWLFEPDTGQITAQCTGTLIRPRWVLTAAHCLVQAEGAAVVLNVPRMKDIRPRHLRYATAAFVAPRYDPERSTADVGLLRLDKAVKVRPVTVAGRRDDERSAAGTTARIVGWGVIDDAFTPTTRLRRGRVTVFGDDACAAYFGGLYVHARMVCGGGKVNDTCVGDSGGPLLVRGRRRWLLLGVTSFGDAACTTGDASVYTRASAARPWIERRTGLHHR